VTSVTFIEYERASPDARPPVRWHVHCVVHNCARQPARMLPRPGTMCRRRRAPFSSRFCRPIGHTPTQAGTPEGGGCRRVYQLHPLALAGSQAGMICNMIVGRTGKPPPRAARAGSTRARPTRRLPARAGAGYLSIITVRGPRGGTAARAGLHDRAGLRRVLVLAACVGHSVAQSRHILNLKTTSRQGQRHTNDQLAAQAGTLVCASASEQFTVSDQTALSKRHVLAGDRD
jgi:hypothetical protein